MGKLDAIIGIDAGGFKIWISPYDLAVCLSTDDGIEAETKKRADGIKSALESLIEIPFKNLPSQCGGGYLSHDAWGINYLSTESIDGLVSMAKDEGIDPGQLYRMIIHSLMIYRSRSAFLIRSLVESSNDLRNEITDLENRISALESKAA